MKRIKQDKDCNHVSWSGNTKTNRFHNVVVCLFSNQFTDATKCDKNKEVRGTPATGECVSDVFTTFWRPVWSITEQTHLLGQEAYFVGNLPGETSNWEQIYIW